MGMRPGHFNRHPLFLLFLGFLFSCLSFSVFLALAFFRSPIHP